MTEKTLEQEARDLLEECGVEDAQQFTAGDLVGIANRLSEITHLKLRIAELEAREKRLRALAEFGYFCLDEMNSGWVEIKADGVAQRLGLLDTNYEPTELAQLPEESS